MGPVFGIEKSECPLQMKIGMGGDWPPYSYKVNRSYQGTDIQILEKVLADFGSHPKYVDIPSTKRAHHLLKTGDIDLMMGATFTEDRNKFVHFSIPYRVEGMGVFVRTSDFEALKERSITQLLNLKYLGAVNLGGYYGDELETLREHHELSKRLVSVSTMEQRLKLLLTGKVDFFIEDAQSVAHWQEQQKVQPKIRFSGYFANTSDIHFMVSRQSVAQDCLERINQGISKFKMGE